MDEDAKYNEGMKDMKTNVVALGGQGFLLLEKDGVFVFERTSDFSGMSERLQFERSLGDRGLWMVKLESDYKSVPAIYVLEAYKWLKSHIGTDNIK